MSKEAKARIKINKLLDEAGWRFEANENGQANIELEPGIKLTDDVGDDFEKISKGYLDYLLLDKDGRPLVVLEAKRESIDPLSAKEQARNYARNVNARFIILSNGNLHYLWDTKHGNPDTISRFPTQDSITQYEQYIPNPKELANTPVDENYIVASQMPSFHKDPDFQNLATRVEFLYRNQLKQMRPYQVQALKSIQVAANNGQSRFLFEMATGTGKTLTSAAVIKLFLQSGNAKRILFLVDRLELEDQAEKAFKAYLGKDYTTVIYKKNPDSWQRAQIVVSTVQTFLAGDRYKKVFSPTDFELVISDEAHRSIGGNSRAVFEYFVGYKLGLTATPKDYLKGFDLEGADTQREFEARQLKDTYKTFGCEVGEPTFRYDLLAGVKEGYLVNPVVVDARTEITTQLLSEEGYSVHRTMEEGDTVDEVFTQRHYEKKFFNEPTNIAMCKAFMDNAFYDPVMKQKGIHLFGKSIVFCVSQSHAARVTNILNKLALEQWPHEYGSSDFAMQVTSQVTGSQQMTINFANNKLSGHVNHPEGYDSSKSRVCVTVGMMTTGYDCEDILNIALMRPVFSPSDFVQIKGRGTRKHRFKYIDYNNNEEVYQAEKESFKFFDFFATCEYFEEDFDYDQKIKLPKITKADLDKDESADNNEAQYVDENGNKVFSGKIELGLSDNLESIQETSIGQDGMRIDRESYKRAVDEDVLGNSDLKTLWDAGDIIAAEEFTKKNIFNKPSHFLNLDKIRKFFDVDRRITVREFLEVAFGLKKKFDTKDELLESEWSKFQEIHKVDQKHYEVARHFFKAYIVDEEVRDIIKRKTYAEFHHSSVFTFQEFEACKAYVTIIPQYVTDYIPLNIFMS